jgi:DNA-directed RNA polymerase sigma subunit (sigma70/sigma32)
MKPPDKASFAIKQRITFGAEISAKLPKKMTLQECGAKLGISYQAVRKAECLALAKVAAQLQEALIKYEQDSR